MNILNAEFSCRYFERNLRFFCDERKIIIFQSHPSVAFELSLLLVKMKSCVLLLGLVLISHSLNLAKSAKVLFPVPPSTLNKACKRSDGSGGVSLFERECPNEIGEMIGFIAHRGNVACCPSPHNIQGSLIQPATPKTPVESTTFTVETKIAGLKVYLDPRAMVCNSKRFFINN